MKTKLAPLLAGWLLVLPCHASFTQTVEYDDQNFALRITGLSKPEKAPGAIKDSYWKFFWEFGDGYYATSQDATIPYDYAESGRYPVRVSLTPFYSLESTQLISNVVEVGAVPPTEEQKENFLDPDQYLGMFTHPTEELTPGNEVQIVLHYRIPAGLSTSDGYLLLFYNNEKELEDLEMDFPLFDITGYRNLESARVIRDHSQMRDIHSSIKENIRVMADGHDMQAFAVSGLDPGKEYRAFLSLEVANILDSTMIKNRQADLKKEKNRVKNDLIVSIWGMFVPKNVYLNERQIMDSSQLILDYVRDPNKIKVKKPKGFAYYHRKRPQEFVYEVKFQNKGTAPANRVDIEIPWNKNLDYNSVEIVGRSPGVVDNCGRCTKNNIPEADEERSCFLLDTSRLRSAGVMVFSFYNIWLHGKKEAGVNKNRYTKGFLVFKTKGNRVKRNKHKTHARIVFHGSFNKDVLETKSITKRWRHRGLGLRLGGNFGGAPDEYFDVLSGFPEQISGGLYFRNTALRTGLGWGLSIDYNQFRFENRTDFLTDTLVNDQFSVLQLERESVNMHVLNLQGQVNARVGGWITGGIGGGVSIPIDARGRIENAVIDVSDFFDAELGIDLDGGTFITKEEFNKVFSLPRLFEDSEVSKFGLLNRKEEELLLFQEDIRSRSLIGLLAHWYLEAGPLDGLAFGVRQSFYIYPKSYKEQCLKINNFEVYLRLKLFTLK